MITYTAHECLHPRCCGSETVLAKARFKPTVVRDRVRKLAPKATRRMRDTMKFWAERWAKKVKGLLAHDLDEVGKASRSQLVDIAMGHLNINEFTAEVVDDLLPSLKKIYQQGGIAGVRSVKVKPTKEITKQVDEGAVKYAEKRSAALIRDLEKTTRDNLRLVISNAVEEGRSSQELADNIEEAFAFSESRAATIARTELATAHVQGNVQGWKETGVVEGKRSILGDLHPEEDECDENADAGAVDIDDEFPSGDDFPPYHPNCMCDVVPVLQGEMDED